MKQREASHDVRKFIAKAADFGSDLKVFAYELLFRTSPENRALPDAHGVAERDCDSMMVFDMERLIGPAKAFVNMDERRCCRKRRSCWIRGAWCWKFSST